MTEEVKDMFTDVAGIEATAAKLAEAIVIEGDALDQLDRELKRRKAALDDQKETLATLMLQAGVTSLKLANGLNPQAKTERKYFKASGIGDDELYAWLREAGLDAIIKPYVHFQTLQATVSEFIEGGGELPAILRAVDRKTIRMNGKSKFLASRQ